MLIRDILGVYLEDRARAGRVVRSIQQQLLPVLRLFGGLEVGAVTWEGLIAYRIERAGERTRHGRRPSESTINRELAYLRAALRLQWRLGRLQSVPPVPMGPEAPPRLDFAVVGQAEALLVALRGVDPPVADLVEWLWHTGWRRREALEMTWSEVRWAEGRVVVEARRIKTRQPRVLPIVGVVDVILRRRWEARAGELVFHRGGRAIRSFRRRWRRVCRLAGVPGLHVHGLRRSLARQHLLQGIPQAVTMAMAGWKSDAIYRRYAIVDESAMARAIIQGGEVRAEAAAAAAEHILNPQLPETEAQP